MRLRWAFLAAALLGLALPALAQRSLKIYISADMEGIAGVVTADRLGPPGFCSGVRPSLDNGRPYFFFSKSGRYCG
jgi:hypothetical protein